MAKREPAFIKHPDVVFVLWDDHHIGRTKKPRALRVQTVGFLMFENEEVIKVAYNYEEDGEVMDDEEITIMRNCIRRYQVLVPATRRTK